MFGKMIIMGYDYSIDIRDDMDEIISECKRSCNDDLSKRSYINDIVYIGMLGSRIVIGIPMEIVKDVYMAMIIVKTIGRVVYKKYGVTYGIELIPNEKSEMIMHILRKGFDIEHTVISETKRDFEARKKVSSEIAEYSADEHSVDPFVVGDSNRLAYQAAWEVIEAPGETYNPLYIYGDSGVGKTHLLHYIEDNILKKKPNAKTIYVTSEDFTNDVIESIRSGSQSVISRMRDKYRTADVFMFDDIQGIIGKDATQEELFNTIITLHLAEKQIIITSDKAPKDLEGLDLRFRSRLSVGLICEIKAPDYELRKEVLEHWSEDAKIDVGLLLCFVKQHDLSIREMKGAFNKLVALSKQKVEVSEDNIEKMLGDIIDSDDRDITH